MSHCYSDWFTPAQVEQALSRLALAADSLGYHGIQPIRLCWVFEHTRIHLALRRDGACLAFFVENRPGATAKLEAPAGGVHESAGLVTAPGGSVTPGFGK